MPDSVLRFGGASLDVTSGELRRDGRRVELPPLTFRLILYLALNRARTVPAAELLEEVWEGLAVSEAALHQALRQARVALGDDGKRQRVIRTIRGGGYQFTAEIEPNRTGDERDARERYVGRAALLEKLERTLDDAVRGRGRVILLSGEAGIGKTRTLIELEQMALARNVLVVHGVGNPHPGAPAFWPWLQVFRELSASRPVHRLRTQVERLAPGLLGEPVDAEVDSPILAESEGRRFRLYDEVNRCLQHASSLGPLLVILDDLHDAGGATLELLEFVAQQVGRSRLLVCGAHRPLGPMRSGDSIGAIARLEERRQAETLAIEGLSNDESRELIRQREPAATSRVLVEALTVRAAGNPFYLMELARLLSDGSAAREPEEWAELIPRGAQRLMSQRFAALSEVAREVLEQASVLGTVFNLVLLRALTSTRPDDAIFEECFRLGFLTESRLGASTLSFSHSLLRDAIYSSMPEARRRQLHLRTAEAIESDQPERLVETAIHLAEALPLGNVERAVDLLGRAGDQARSVFDPEQAWRLYRRAVGLLDRWPAADLTLRCRLSISAGEVAARGELLVEARELLIEGMSIARRIGSIDLFSRAALSYAYAGDYLAAENEEIVAFLEEALAMDASGTNALRAQVLSRLAVEVRYRQPASEQALSLLDEAIDLARSLKGVNTLPRVLEDASVVRWSVDDPDGWRALNEEIVAEAERSQNYDLLFQGVKGLATAWMETGNRDAMDREIDRCKALAKEFPAPYQRAALVMMGASQYFLAGDFERGERCAIQALSAGLPAITPPALTQLYYHRLETGRIGELEDRLRVIVAEAPNIVGWRYATARLLVDLGRHDEARQEIAAAPLPTEAPRDRTWLVGVAVLVESVCALGDTDRAAFLYDLLKPYTRVNVVGGSASVFYGNVSHYLGMLAATLGLLDDAETAFRSALQMHRRMRAVPWILRTEFETAEILRILGDAGPALEIKKRVAERAEQLGMWSLAKRASRAS